MLALLENSYFALFVIICIGFIIGNISIKGVSLEVSAIIFVALVFGHYGVELPDIIEKIGLILFIYTIGLQAGPGFFDSFKKQGRNLVLITSVVILSAALLTYLSTVLLGVEMPMALGLFTGALTSTPGLATAIEVHNSPLVSIGYGLAYPFGVIGVILFVKLYPKLIRADIKKAEKDYDYSENSKHPLITYQHVRVENENIFGKSLGELRFRAMTQTVVSRVMHGQKAVVPTPATVLQKGDLVRIVGTEDALKRAVVMLGSVTKDEIPLNEGYTVETVLVTNRDVIGKDLGSLNLWSNYKATITRIRRSGIDFSPSKGTTLMMGDKLTIACTTENFKQVSVSLGNDDRRLSDTDFFPIALGIVIGVLIGNLSISFGNSFTFSLGLTGGIMIVAMLLSRLGRTGPIIWTMSGAANQLLRQLGLMLFLAAVGTKAGSTLVETYQGYGAQLFFIGAALTIIPMVMAVVIAYFMASKNVLVLLGTIAGAMTSTPGLAAVDSMSDSNAPAIAYATVYPIAMVLLVICVQILSAM
jgi:putative transport protein